MAEVEHTNIRTPIRKDVKMRHQIDSDQSSFFVGNLGTSAGTLLTTSDASNAVYTSAASLLNN